MEKKKKISKNTNNIPVGTYGHAPLTNSTLNGPITAIVAAAKSTVKNLNSNKNKAETKKQVGNPSTVIDNTSKPAKSTVSSIMKLQDLNSNDNKNTTTNTIKKERNWNFSTGGNPYAKKEQGWNTGTVVNPYGKGSRGGI